MEPENYGQLLYQKGQAAKINLDQKREKLKEDMVHQEMANATFKPAIKGTKQRGNREKGIKTEDFLLFQGRLANEKKERLKKDIQQQESVELSFKPNILKKSEQIVQRRNQRHLSENVSEGTSNFEPKRKTNELYQEAFVRHQRLERLQRQPADDECTFMPKLVSKTKNETMNKSIISTEPEHNSLIGINGTIKEVDESQEVTSGNVFERLTMDA